MLEVGAAANPRSASVSRQPGIRSPEAFMLTEYQSLP